MLFIIYNMWPRKTFLLKCVALQYAKIGVSEYYISFDFTFS